jgi:hypothetical protein
MRNKRQSKTIVVWKTMGLWGLFSNTSLNNIGCCLVHARIRTFMYYWICISWVGQKLNIESRNFRKGVNKCIKAYMRQIIPETRHAH